MLWNVHSLSTAFHFSSHPQDDMILESSMLTSKTLRATTRRYGFCHLQYWRSPLFEIVSVLCGERNGVLIDSNWRCVTTASAGKSFYQHRSSIDHSSWGGACNWKTSKSEMSGRRTIDYSAWQGFLLFLYVASGTLQPILIEVLTYNGACEKSTFLFILPTYVGMSMSLLSNMDALNFISKVLIGI